MEAGDDVVRWRLSQICTEDQTNRLIEWLKVESPYIVADTISSGLLSCDSLSEMTRQFKVRQDTPSGSAGNAFWDVFQDLHMYGCWDVFQKLLSCILSPDTTTQFDLAKMLFPWSAGALEGESGHSGSDETSEAAPLRLFHGTSRAVADSIRRRGKPDLDTAFEGEFGSGFYLGTHEETAIEWAERERRYSKRLQAVAEALNIPTDVDDVMTDSRFDPVVLQFDVPREIRDFLEFKALWVPPSDEFEDDQWRRRGGYKRALSTWSSLHHVDRSAVKAHIKSFFNKQLFIVTLAGRDTMEAVPFKSLWYFRNLAHSSNDLFAVFSSRSTMMIRPVPS